MVEISLIELEMYVIAALGARGVQASRIVVQPSNADGGWQIESAPYGVVDVAAFAKVAQEVERELSAKYKVRRQSRGGASGPRARCAAQDNRSLPRT